MRSGFANDKLHFYVATCRPRPHPCRDARRRLNLPAAALKRAVQRVHRWTPEDIHRTENVWRPPSPTACAAVSPVSDKPCTPQRHGHLKALLEKVMVAKSRASAPP